MENLSVDRSVGIDGIAFELPKYYVDMTDLARARKVDPAKYCNGLGQLEMSVASPCEDTVTLAAGAGRRVINSFGINPDSIGLVIVGTETSVDHSKPVSSFVHQMLGLSKECRVIEIKHACYGALAGVSIATDWILSGRNQSKCALVIASDIARYELHSAGEPTQGAGAVALIISENPRLLSFETQFQGFYAKQVMDFWRPLYRKEALVDGHFSINCYLDALAGAYSMYQRSFRKNNIIQADKEELISSQFSACLYHVPFVKMAWKGHKKLLEQDWNLVIEKDTNEMEQATLDFQSRVSPYLKLNARVGNIYTGSLFLSLCEFISNVDHSMIDKKISLFGYGSGCAAEFFSARIVSSDQGKIKKEEIMNKRQKISIDHYEEILFASQLGDANDSTVCDPLKWNLDGPFLYLGTKNHIRTYESFLE